MSLFPFLSPKEPIDDPEYYAYLADCLAKLRAWSTALAQTVSDPDRWPKVFDEAVEIRRLAVQSMQTEPPKALRKFHRSLDASFWAIRAVDEAQMAYFTALATQGPEGIFTVVSTKTTADKAVERMQKRFTELEGAIGSVIRSGLVNDPAVTGAAGRLFGWKNR